MTEEKEDEKNEMKEGKENKAIICSELYDFLDDCSMKYKDSINSPIAEKRNEAKGIRKTALAGLLNYISSDGFEGGYRDRIKALLKLTPDLKEAKGYHQSGCVYNSKSLEEALENCLDIKHLSLRAYGKYRTKVLCSDPLVDTVNVMLKNKKNSEEYNPKLLYDFVVQSNELENLKNAGINKENRQLRIKGKPIEDRTLYLLALSYARKGLKEVKENLSSEEPSVGDKPFTEVFFSNNGINNYELLKKFVEKKSEILLYPEKLKGILEKCDKTVDEAKKIFSSFAFAKQDKLYEKAIELAQKGNENYERVLKEFVEFSVKYNEILDEDQDSLAEAFKKIIDAYDDTHAASKIN